MTRRSANRWLLLAFAATVIICAAASAFEVTRLLHATHTVVKSSQDAHREIAARVSDFANDVAHRAATGFPSNATLTQLASAHDLQVWDIERGMSLSMTVAGSDVYGLGLDGQAVRDCYQVVVSAVGNPSPGIDQLPTCPAYSPAPYGS